MNAARWIILLLLVPQTLWGINNAVPYVRQGISYFDPDWLNGYGAIAGVLEVQGTEGNGIDGFAGHAHSAIAAQTDAFGYSYGFQDVKDFKDDDPTDNNFHGTFVAGIMASQYSTFTGVAPFAKYYGAVFDGSDSKAAFLSLNSSLNYLVSQGVQTINNSWGNTPTATSQLTGSYFVESLLMDEYTGYRGKTAGTTAAYNNRLVVIAAGNAGEETGLLGGPADSFNTLVVGALASGSTPGSAWDDPTRVPVAQVASYSSWRPLADGRNGVHVVAPGSDLWSTLAINYFNTNDLVAGTASGTSFAAPHVTGVATLLYGAPTQPLWSGATYKGTVLSTDHKLIKAIIINSADKIAGLDSNGVAQAIWLPGQFSQQDGVTTALAPLNYAVGAGAVNAADAFLTYAEASNRFWALSTLTTAGQMDYYTLGEGKFTTADPNLTELYGLTATLVWDRHVDFTVNTDINSAEAGTADKDLLSQLELYLQRQLSPGVWTNVYISAAVPSSLQHIYMPMLPTNGIYRLAVRANTLAEPALGEEYALAVEFIMVPEPGGWLLVVVGWAVLRGRRRPRGASLFRACSNES
ncbi:MAG: S8 family serine peptidase [Verrucomicrobia bacterium]|nr:S8 family serine peptidase [Verrucomicrobiota bacterium]